MDTTRTESAPESRECSMCWTVSTLTKSLTCSHAFCQICLGEILDSPCDAREPECPRCSGEASEPESREGSSESEYTSTKESSRKDLWEEGEKCTLCETKEQSAAVFYCERCGHYVCESCYGEHRVWKAFSGYCNGDKASARKLSSKSRRACRTHTNEEESCFCLDCGQYICIKCVVSDHAPQGHHLLDASVHETQLEKTIQELRVRAEAKKVTIWSQIQAIQEQKPLLQRTLNQLHGDIDKVHARIAQTLEQRKKILKEDAETRVQKLETELQDIEDACRQSIALAESIEEQLSVGVGVRLENEKFTSHKSLCADMESLLGEADPDVNRPSDVVNRGKRIRLCRNRGPKDVNIGEIADTTGQWHQKCERSIPAAACEDIISFSDGKVGVASRLGGIYIYNEDGWLDRSMQTGMPIAKLALLSEGQLVIRDRDNNIVLWSSDGKRLGVKFETIDNHKGGFGGLTVDTKDQIYTGYRKIKKIHVLARTGGKAIKEIPCHYCRFGPILAFMMNTKGQLLLKGSEVSLMTISYSFVWTVQNTYTVEGDVCLYPAVCNDESILIASVRDSLLNISHYTSELKFIKVLVSDVNIGRTLPGAMCNLAEYESGNAIAFVTTDTLYLFSKVT